MMYRRETTRISLAVNVLDVGATARFSGSVRAMWAVDQYPTRMEA